MARQQPKHLVGQGELTEEFDCLGVVGLRGVGGVFEVPNVDVLAIECYSDFPEFRGFEPYHSLKSAGVVFRHAGVSIVLASCADTHIASLVVNTITIYMVNVHPDRSIGQKPVHSDFMEILSSACVPIRVHGIARFLGSPLELVDPFVVLVIDDSDVAFCEGDCFHAGEWKRPAPGIEDFEAGGASRILAKSDVVFNAPLSYHNQPGSQVFTE